MKSALTKGIICCRDRYGFEYHVCELEHYVFEDETFKYIFKPNYCVIDLLEGNNLFQGLPGIDLGLRQEAYIRENINPVFIAERTPASNREDLYQLLETVGLNYLNPIEYLIRTDMKYSGDNLYVIGYEGREKIVLDEVAHRNNVHGMLKIAISNIAKGNDVELKDGTILNDKNTFNTLMFLYKKNLDVKAISNKHGILIAKQNGKYKGRKPIEVDRLLFEEQLERIKNKHTTAREAAKDLGISIDKFYRYKKLLQK